ncbi:ciliary microtubule inner protein 2A [Lepidochelys kempii]|uniref:ciliary microtubule inner protein 2A n=1 Tax=Lepidochelys kempii TaxID=8472 RepID=UPI003C703792
MAMDEGIFLLVAGQQHQETAMQGQQQLTQALLMQLMENLQWQQEVQFVVQQWWQEIHFNQQEWIQRRYGGFYPQIRYQIGETYGKTTSRLLTDCSVLKSPCSVLAPLMKPRFTEDFSGTKHPSNQMLDQNYSYLPGYTEMFGSFKAVAYIQKVSDLKCAWPVRIEGVPLDAVTETVDVSRYNQLPKLDVPNLIQRKAISGYTGFIPRFTWIMGVNYLQGVKDAMNEFDRNQFMIRNPVWNFGKRLPQTYWPNKKIYTSAGLIPFYTGFVPSKFIL